MLANFRQDKYFNKNQLKVHLLAFSRNYNLQSQEWNVRLN